MKNVFREQKNENVTTVMRYSIKGLEDKFKKTNVEKQSKTKCGK